MKKHFVQRRLAAALSVGLILATAGCGAQGGAPAGNGKTVELTEALLCTAPEGVEAANAAQAEQLTEFALKLTEETYKTGENMLLSPLSALMALGMVQNGAEGETLAEMEQLFGVERGALNDAMYAYLQAAQESEKAALCPANSLWITDREEVSVREDFLKTVLTYYQAEVYETPMNDRTAKDINRWVKDNTDGMIEAIVGEIPVDTVMYLINALTFEGEWPVPYEASQVQDGVFRTEEGGMVNVSMLHSDEHTYLENEAVTGVMKPYKGGKYAFVGLLPKDNRSLEETLVALDGVALQKLLRETYQCTVITRIPKFETASAVKLNEPLQRLGMEKAFSPFDADFTGMGTSENGAIHISEVLQKTYLSLGEKGTRAGAVTAIAAKDSCVLEVERPKEVFLDRPFLYMLIDTETCVPFFIGAMCNPVQ